ncbi:hypothetical protein KC887_02655 [Candidatus Kaiserbacteria bacterium]|nr:hypothetical protein [Candidatus Kaiserbacteria bacterium]
MEQLPEKPRAAEKITVEEALQTVCAELSQADAEQLTPVEFYFEGVDTDTVQMFWIHKGVNLEPESHLGALATILSERLNTTTDVDYLVTVETYGEGTSGEKRYIKIEHIA